MTEQHRLVACNTLPHRPTVELQLVTFADTISQLGNAAVQANTTGPYPVLSLAAGGQSEMSENFLDTLSQAERTSESETDSSTPSPSSTL